MSRPTRFIGETGALGAPIGDLSPEATYTIDFGHATTAIGGQHDSHPYRVDSHAIVYRARSRRLLRISRPRCCVITPGRRE